MQVEIKEPKNSVLLSSIPVGAAFSMNGGGNSRYMRVVADSEHLKLTQSTVVTRIPIVNLNTGSMSCPVSTVRVTLIEAKVVCDD